VRLISVMALGMLALGAILWLALPEEPSNVTPADRASPPEVDDLLDAARTLRASGAPASPLIETVRRAGSHRRPVEQHWPLRCGIEMEGRRLATSLRQAT
jgi:hypothetical protein